MKAIKTKSYFDLNKFAQNEETNQSVPLDQPLPEASSPAPIVEEGLQKYLDAFMKAARENNTEECHSILDYLRQQVDMAAKLPGWKNVSKPKPEVKPFFQPLYDQTTD